jgi:hypothetical protein
MSIVPAKLRRELLWDFTIPNREISKIGDFSKNRIKVRNKLERVFFWDSLGASNLIDSNFFMFSKDAVSLSFDFRSFEFHDFYTGFARDISFSGKASCDSELSLDINYSSWINAFSRGGSFEYRVYDEGRKTLFTSPTPKLLLYSNSKSDKIEISPDLPMDYVDYFLNLERRFLACSKEAGEPVDWISKTS